jgi:hypothetical protein
MGQVTVESFYTVATECSWFVKGMRLPSLQ